MTSLKTVGGLPAWVVIAFIAIGSIIIIIIIMFVIKCWKKQFESDKNKKPTLELNEEEFRDNI